ncbi:MAG: recombination protein O N-terminal domain-containing protein [bacterium]|nr:recombination protein O N-terminal domain-containing protein [bacterium]
MAHHLYETDAFIVGLYPANEANRTYLLFTENLGLVEAKAQGVRLNKSKLRYSLQAISKTRISLVRGREQWRIVGAQEPTHYWLDFKEEPEKVALIERFLFLVRRLIHGEERNLRVYQTLNLAINFLEETKVISNEELYLLEIVAVARILSALGYFEPKKTYLEILEENGITAESLTKANLCKKELLFDINSALKETHL